MSPASRPGGKAALAMMRAALVEAKVGVSRVRAALDATQAQLAHERDELETVRRRGRLATEIHDGETARIAARFEQKHSERVAVLERKAAAQESELALAERELAEMAEQFRAMSGGVAPPPPPPPSAEPDDHLAQDIDAMRRTSERATREADAQQRLEELKRKMGKDSR